MAVNVSRLRAAGLAKEIVAGTPIATPTRFMNIVPPDAFSPMIEPLPSKGIEALTNMYPKITQGPLSLNGLKIKLEVEPENIGEILQALFGQDTATEVVSFVVTLNTNDHIDFKEDAGSQLHAQIAAGTYAIGTSSAQVGTLCAAIKTALQAVGSGTYTVTYSYTTKKMTIAEGGAKTNVQILWLTGTNNAQGAFSLLGFTKADTSNSTSVTSDSTTQVAPFQHVFTRAQVSQLPTYTWWFDKNPKYQVIAGCMLDKLDLALKSKGIMEADADWVGLVNDDSDGTSQATVFSALNPLIWANAVMTVDSVQKNGYDNFKLSLKNNVKADHALNNSISPYISYAEGFTPEVSAELFFEDTTQYQKFLAGTTAHLSVAITSGQVIGGTVKYSLTIDIPAWYYKSANIFIPSNGPLKIPFTGMAQYSVSSGYDVKATLVNSVSTAY